MNEEFEMMTQRLKTGLDPASAASSMDVVAERYGMVEGNPFSFDNHEFQREIMRCTSSRLYVRKCSQVGLSEMAVQKLLALCVTLKHKRIIYTMPTQGMAAQFSKDRISGLINQSPYYRSNVLTANDSASQKHIGTCTLYVGGTFGATGAISVPAEVVINDEIDHSNPQVLGMLSSRLRHASKDERGYSGTRIKFSTPTLSDYGIDVDFQRGTQRYYAAECSHCDEWVVPDFLQDFRVPGLDKPIIELDRPDLSNPAYHFQDAWIACPECEGDLWEDLCDPQRRKWIARYPERWEESYHVSPWDAPAYNTPASIIRQFGEYHSTADFYNMVIGLPFSSADNSFLYDEEHKDRVATAELWPFHRGVTPRSGATTVAGLDIGKRCHLIVMAISGDTEYVVWSEVIQNSLESPAAQAVMERFEYFNVVRLVVDAGPDLTLVNQLVDAKPLGVISACQYVRKVSGLDIIAEKDDGRIIQADRTKTLDDTMKAHNSAKIRYPRAHVDDIFAHLKPIKKVRNLDVSGDQVERFESANPEDHFGHALNYARIAKRALGQFHTTQTVSMPPTVGRLRIGGNAKK